MTFDTVRGIISEQLGIDEDSISTEALIIDDLGADSLDVVDLLIAFEDEFDVKIPDEDVEKFKTVGDIVKYVEEKTAE